MTTVSDQATVEHPLPEGTHARVVRFVEGFEARVGTEFEVEDYVTAEQAEDGVAFYWGSRHGGINNVTAAASSIEVVRTAEQMRARRVPTCEEVARGLSLLGDHDTFDCDETEPDGSLVTCYGATPDGLRVAVEVRVVGVTWVDW
jgi:hypothetical protein